MNVFQKKQWTRIGLSIVAVIAAALFLTGIIGGKPMTYRIGENDQELTASEQGYKGEVTAHVVLNGDKTVKSLSIDTPDESEGLGKRASEAEFTDQFIGKAGPFTFGEEGIEALSGATVTSNAALKAINRAAAGETEEPAEEQPAEEKPEEEKPAEEKPDEGKPAEEPVKTEEGGASSGLVYGSYMSEKETDFSTIRVTVNTRNDVITDCEVRCDAKEGQTDLVKDEDEEAWAKAIVETQGKEIDTVSGATISSDAVREAVAEILERIR